MNGFIIVLALAFIMIAIAPLNTTIIKTGTEEQNNIMFGITGGLALSIVGIIIYEVKKPVKEWSKI